MESVNSFWMVVAIVFGIGAIVGAVVHRLFNVSGKKTAKLQQRLEQVEDELKTYKESVNRHFSKTSELVSELTQDYVKVYKHLVEGAKELGDPSEFTNVLEQQQGKMLISFADEVVPPAEDKEQGVDTDAAPITAKKQGTEQPAATKDEESDQATTPASQAHLSESMKKVAEKMKGAESSAQAKDVPTAPGSSVKEGAVEAGNAARSSDGGTDKAAAKNQHKTEPRLQSKTGQKVDSAAEVRPEQRSGKQ